MIIIIRKYQFNVFKSKNGIYYFMPSKKQGLGKYQRKMIEDLVLNNKDIYIGKDIKVIKQRISLFIRRKKKILKDYIIV